MGAAVEFIRDVLFSVRCRSRVDPGVRESRSAPLQGGFKAPPVVCVAAEYPTVAVLV